MHITITLDYDNLNNDRVYTLEWTDDDDTPQYIKFFHNSNFLHMTEKNIITKLEEYVEANIGVITSYDLVYTGSYSMYEMTHLFKTPPFGI